jgi:beta-lactam-binding protein with PASTA domain
MGFLKFLTSGTFFKHLGIAIVLVALLIWLTLQILKVYTSHGDEILVPGFTGVRIDKVHDMEIGEDFEFVVIDSVYDDHFSKGEIVLQDPVPGSKVKHGRKIYVTIVANQPEMVVMPDLVDLSLRQALHELKANSLKLDKLQYVPNFAKNAVLAQRIEGDTIDVGIEVLKGTSVELVMGAGLNNDKVEVPFLIGKTESEAIKLLNNSGLNVGYLKYLDGRDKIHSRVYEQQPQPIENTRAEYGAYVDLWFRNDGFYNFDSLVANYNIDPEQAEPDSIATQKPVE